MRLRIICGRNDPVTPSALLKFSFVYFRRLPLTVSRLHDRFYISCTLRVSAIELPALPFRLLRSHRVLFATRTGRCAHILARGEIEILFDPVAALIYLRRYVDGAHTKESACE
jgi:hypothetical protein